MILLCLLFLFVGINAKYTYETKWFTVPLDHFSFQNNQTFKIKYLVNDTFWSKGDGPIFFYTGNEGQIEVFAQHTGFMWDIAEEFQAKLVFAEHRYYGASKPFGDNSLKNEYIGYLSASQALADYADLIDFLQDSQIRPKYPVIAFGGSYGGMLSAYFRMKYPHIVTGAIAASAPIHMYPDMVPCDAFQRIVTSSFKVANVKCMENIKHSWAVLRNFTKSANNTAWLQKQWRICDPIKTDKDIDNLFGFLESVYGTLAMVNYPYPTDFLVSLPGNPVRYVCQFLSEKLTGKPLVEAIGKVLETYTNYDHNDKCVNITKGDDYGNLDAEGWDYQACTEMVMPICTTGKDDMFEPSPWNITKFSEDCYKKYNTYPRPNNARIEFGGGRIDAASNIVFSNGLLDPWAGGGILNSISDSVKAVVLIDTAHHLDLMPKNDLDPSSVKMAREIHKQSIRQWIHNYREAEAKMIKSHT